MVFPWRPDNIRLLRVEDSTREGQELALVISACGSVANRALPDCALRHLPHWKAEKKMNIDHSVLVRFVELAESAKQPKRNYRLVLTPHGVEVRGYDMGSLKEFLSFAKVIRWETLSSPAGIPLLEAEFEKLTEAVQRKVESRNEQPIRTATR
jgi:hypothetical protein